MLAIPGELCCLEFFKTVYLETSNMQSFFPKSSHTCHLCTKQPAYSSLLCMVCSMQCNKRVEVFLSVDFKYPVQYSRNGFAVHYMTCNVTTVSFNYYQCL